MNGALETLATTIDLNGTENERLRYAFGHLCVARIEHLLEDPAVIECVHVFRSFLSGNADHAAFAEAQRQAERLANEHRGSQSIDGCGHAAVSASYAVAKAINGNALQAADYAAYAKVYAFGGYGAVGDQNAFEPEFTWQVEALQGLLAKNQSHLQHRRSVKRAVA